MLPGARSLPGVSVIDKRISYSGQIPLDLDWQEPQRNTEIALGYLMQAVMGTSTVIDGLAVTQQASPNMTVQVGTGSIISYTTVDPTGVAFGALTLDVGNLVKVGINRSPVNMTALTAPSTAGQSQNWLIEAKFLEADGSATVLPYYNSTNPSIPYTGPANAGTSQNTRRTNTVQLQWKAGTAAATGQQNTPTPDAGWTGIAIVTVANGQASITNANITAYSAAPNVPTKMPQLRKQLTANLQMYVSTFGNDTNNSGLSASSPFLTLQKAWNYIIGTLDLNGFSVTVNVANGTYTGGLVAQGAPPGLGSGNAISFVGNTTTPSSVAITTTNAHCFQVQNGAAISVSGFQMAASGTAGGVGCCAILAANAGNVSVSGNVTFGACAAYHMWSTQSALIQVGVSYTISGSALTHIIAQAGAFINAGGSAITVTLSGTPGFTSGFAVASILGAVQFPSVTFSGSASAGTPRYSAAMNGVINTSSGALATYFPGGSAGSVATGGVYQ